MTTTVRHDTIDTKKGRLFLARWNPDIRKSDVPLILMHDSLGCVALWRDFPARLAQACGREVVAYDRLGFGRSDAFDGWLAPDFIATEADAGFADVLRHLDVQRFALFGHSVGGGIAVHCAARYPHQCEALITESAQAFVEDRTLEGIRTAQALFSDPVQVERLAKYHGEKARWVLDAWIDTWLSPGFADWSLKPALPQLACPVLAIHGEQDEYGSFAHPQLIASMAGAGGRAHIMPGTHHVPHRENEEEIIDLVAHHLS